MAEAEAGLRRSLAIDAASDRGPSDASHRAREVSTLDVLASLAVGVHGAGDGRAVTIG